MKCDVLFYSTYINDGDISIVRKMGYSCKVKGVLFYAYTVENNKVVIIDPKTGAAVYVFEDTKRDECDAIVTLKELVERAYNCFGESEKYKKFVKLQKTEEYKVIRKGFKAIKQVLSLNIVKVLSEDDK